MALRHNHYEAAFEDYVRSRGWPYVPVDEKKRAIFAGSRIKSFDFIVYGASRQPWLVDIKGRKFPYVTCGGRRYWENWVTRGDLDGLRQWKAVFGENFEPAIVFAYWVLGRSDREPIGDPHVFRNEYYRFMWVSASTYAEHARTRSPKWDTVSVPNREFRRLVQPLATG